MGHLLRITARSSGAHPSPDPLGRLWRMRRMHGSFPTRIHHNRRLSNLTPFQQCDYYDV